MRRLRRIKNVWTCPCNLSVNTIRLIRSILLVIIVLDLLCVNLPVTLSNFQPHFIKIKFTVNRFSQLHSQKFYTLFVLSDFLERQSCQFPYGSLKWNLKVIFYENYFGRLFPGFLIKVCFYFSHNIIFESSNFSIFEKDIWNWYFLPSGYKA